ncbi:DUF488 domain-containing protein [bacterium]|nr:DUF488 domain-containing protein [bacterium]
MYYRRKLLLALIESFGGSLPRTDCIKLLFLFNQKSKEQHYTFFPYKFGGFSFIAYQDKARLESLGLLASQHDFSLNTDQSFIGQLKVEDRILLEDLAKEWKGNLGKDLIKGAYLRYPYFAIKSEIAEEILTTKEMEKVHGTHILEDDPCLFSIGYEGKSIDAFLNDLIKNNIKTLVDVRKMPRSMKYGFSKTKLSQYLGKIGVQYVHCPDLGIPSELRKSLETDEDYRKLFGLYDSQILPDQHNALENILGILKDRSRIALMCFEADPNHCHRNRIVEYLVNSMKLKSEVKHV